MKTDKEIRDAKSRMITQGRMLEELKNNEAFQILMEQLQKKIDLAESALLDAEDWQDYIRKQATYKGLMALALEVDTIISKGKAKERILKIK